MWVAFAPILRLGQPPRGDWSAEAPGRWLHSILALDHTAWTLATDLHEAAHSFLKKASVCVNRASLWISHPVSSAPWARDLGASRSLLPFPLPFPLHMTCQPIPGLPLPAPPANNLPSPPSPPDPAPVTTGPASGPLCWPFPLPECSSPAVPTSFISFALKNVCQGGELQERSDYSYPVHYCVPRS